MHAASTATVAALAAGAGVLSLLSLVPTTIEQAMGESAMVAATALVIVKCLPPK